ncbi:MAG: phenylalanine--tRNA ligase subunit alpha [Nitrospinae bacterium]|nr:phenylalanine--tRNA ligase subunit alpha [Nitrospinota bacterium]
MGNTAENDIQNIRDEFISSLTAAEGLAGVESVRVKYLGKKGTITNILKSLGGLSPEERKAAGALANKLKAEAESLVAEREERFKKEERARKLKEEQLDISLPGAYYRAGSSHPIPATLIEICEVFTAIGFTVAEGPEIDTEENNFDMLNFKKDHPARDMQDTFYISEGILLRAHTSTVQIRTMLKQKPPIAIVAPGRVYRRDSDQTHSPMFHQIEGLFVDTNVTFRDLKGILKIFLESTFRKGIPIRFRPSFFPFTEPSAEVDIGCTVCNGSGCRMCKNTGWLEIMGCGMVDPNVFEAVGVDPKVYSGCAFGMGVERIAMLKYRLSDIRKFYENDMRFNRQFTGLR